MTPDDPPAAGRLRLQNLLDADLKAWIEDRMKPGSIFLSFGHAAELAWGRLEDEAAYLKAQSKAKRIPFDLEAVHRIYEAALEASRPPLVGRPSKDAKPGPARVRVSMFVSPTILDAIHAESEPDGPYSAASPVPHAIETALRVLRDSEQPGPMRSGLFAFDGDKLWTRYMQARAKAK